MVHAGHVAAHPGHDVAAGGRVAPQREPALHAARPGWSGWWRCRRPARAPRGPCCGRRPGSPSPRPAGGGGPCPGRTRRRPRRAAAASSRPMPSTTASPPPSSDQADGDDGQQHGPQGTAGGAAAGVSVTVGLGSMRVRARAGSSCPPTGRRRRSPTATVGAGQHRVGDEVGVLAARARLGGELVVQRQEVRELLDPLVVGRVELQLVAPRLDADRRVQARVGRHHPAGLVLDQLRQRVDVGLAHVVGVVGDPHGAVLEAVHGVLVPDVDGVDGAGAVGPVRRRGVRPADRRGLGVVHRRRPRAPGRRGSRRS